MTFLNVYDKALGYPRALLYNVYSKCKA